MLRCKCFTLCRVGVACSHTQGQSQQDTHRSPTIRQGLYMPPSAVADMVQNDSIFDSFCTFLKYRQLSESKFRRLPNATSKFGSKSGADAVGNVGKIQEAEPAQSEQGLSSADGTSYIRNFITADVHARSSSKPDARFLMHSPCSVQIRSRIPSGLRRAVPLVKHVGQS